MLAVLTSWIIITFVFFSFGNLGIFVFAKISKQREEYNLLDTFLIGMVTVATFVSVWSLFAPADSVLLLVLVGLSALYFVFRKKHFAKILYDLQAEIKKQRWISLFLILSPLLIFLIHSLTAPLWVDTPYYHLQNIMWNEQYSIVPGLANLQPRFGFNSSYYLLCSTFGLKPVFGQYIFGIHQLCLAYIFVWIIARTVKSESIAKSIFPILLITIFTVVYKLHITSPSSDLLPNLLILYVFIKLIFDKDAIIRQPLMFILVPCFCLTLKLSSGIIGLFSIAVLYGCLKNRSIRSAVTYIACAFVVIVPWLVRTSIITGYLIFPYPAIDIFSFDWKVPIEYVTEQKDYIMAFARIDGAPVEDTLALSFSQWIPQWLRSGMFYYNPYANRIFLALILLSMVLMPTLCLAIRSVVKGYKSLLLAWLVALAGILVWFTSAPDFRFAYGLILPFCLIPGYILTDFIVQRKQYNKKTIQSISLTISIIIILFINLQAVRWSFYQRDASLPKAGMLYMPQNIGYTKKLKEDKYNKSIEFVPTLVNGMYIYNATIETHCYDCPLPCSSDYTGGLEMRGNNLQNGFRSRAGAPHHRGY